MFVDSLKNALLPIKSGTVTSKKISTNQFIDNQNYKR